MDELARGYSQPWFQALVQNCLDECCHDQQQLLQRLHDIAFEAEFKDLKRNRIDHSNRSLSPQVQKPVLENWGFEGNDQGGPQDAASLAASVLS